MILTTIEISVAEYKNRTPVIVTRSSYLPTYLLTYYYNKLLSKATSLEKTSKKTL